MLYIWCLSYLLWYINITFDICLFGVIYTLKYKINKLCLVTLPCAWILAHSKVTIWGFLCRQSDLSFAVCLWSWHTAKFESLPCASDPGTRRSSNLCHVPWMPAHGKSGSQRRHHRAVTVPATTPPSSTLICRVPALAHGKGLVAVGASPWAAHDKYVCRVFLGLRRVPGAHSKCAESGSDPFRSALWIL